MRNLILLTLLTLNFNILFAQEQATNEFPKLKLSYETDEEIRVDVSPEMSYQFKYNNREILVAFFFAEKFWGSAFIVTYINFADTWQPLHQTEVEYADIYKELKFFETSKSKFVYFEYVIHGGGSSLQKTHSFVLFDIINNEIHELSYNGYINEENDYIRLENGTFEFNNLLKYPEILGVLENQAKVSKYIVRN